MKAADKHGKRVVSTKQRNADRTGVKAIRQSIGKGRDQRRRLK